MLSVESDNGRVLAVTVEADSDDLGYLSKSEKARWPDVGHHKRLGNFNGDSQQPTEA